MTRRPISDTYRAWLLEEIEIWRGRGLLPEQQIAQILDLYETPTDTTRRKTSKASLALMSVAALLVGMAVLLLIGYNWEALPAAGKLAIIFGILIGTYAAAFWTRYRERAPARSQVLFFLASLFYGCAIWLVAQVFNIQSHYPNGFWIWAVGVLPFALCLNSTLLHLLLATLLGVWCGTEILAFDRFLQPGQFGGGYSLHVACYSLPLLALPGLWQAYRKGSALTVGIYLPLIVWWTVLQRLAWTFDADFVYFLGGLGALLLVLAECHRIRSLLAIPYRLYGVLLVAGVLVPLSFAAAQRELWFTRDTPAVALVSSLLILALGLAAVVWAAEVKPQLRRQQLTRSQAWGRLLQVNWLPIAVLCLMTGLEAWKAVLSTGQPGGYWAGSPQTLWSLPVLVPTVLCNAAMIALAIWLMHIGMREDRGRPFAAGVIYFLLWAVLRYIDLFGEAGGMLGAALMFFLCGASLFGIARFWHHRKGVADE